MRGLRQWFAESLTYKWARRIAISLIGGTVILIGVAMIVLPGPALVVIPLGLGILGLEFACDVLTTGHWPSYLLLPSLALPPGMLG